MTTAGRRRGWRPRIRSTPDAAIPRVPGILTRQDVEERERRARRRPPWTRRPRESLHGRSALIMLPVLAPVVVVGAGVRALLGLNGHGWPQVLALPLLGSGAALLVLDLLYLRRPLRKRPRPGTPAQESRPSQEKAAGPPPG